MSASHPDFRSSVARLARGRRRDLLLRRSTDGLFYGLLPALAIALLSHAVALPSPVICAAAAAVVGVASGALSAVLAPLDRTRLLIQADSVLASRELASTAYELDGAGATGAFAEAVVEDAERLLAATTPRAILGRRRLPLAPFAALAALCTAAALLFPFDLRALLPRQERPGAMLSQIGEDLRKKGQTLAEDARAGDRARFLELSENLTQLGSDLAARRIAPEEALDRMSDMESGLAQEYELRLQQVQSDAAQAGPGTAGSGGKGDEATNPGGSRGAGTPGSSSTAGPEGDGALRDLGSALDRLRQAQRELGGQNPGGSDQAAQDPARPGQQRNLPGRQGSPGPAPGKGDSGDTAHRGGDTGSAPGGGRGDEDPGRPGDSGGSGVGTLPAPLKRGAPTPLIEGNRGPGLQARGDGAEGEATRLLARALPRWTPSGLPEATILNRYSRQAESALARDEVPLKLRQSVKEYFTAIGLAK